MARILLMEDDNEQAWLLSEGLIAAGHVVEVANGASEALARAETETFDLLIVDIFVKRNDSYTPDGGLLLIGKFRNPGLAKRVPWAPDTPIIAVTGIGEREFSPSPLRMARNLGANATFGKPIDLNELRAEIDRLLTARDAAGEATAG